MSISDHVWLGIFLTLIHISYCFFFPLNHQIYRSLLGKFLIYGGSAIVIPYLLWISYRLYQVI